MARVTFAVMYRSASSKSLGCEDLNKFWKYSDATFSIPSLLSAQPPFKDFSLVIWFRARLCFVMAWKNLVFFYLHSLATEPYFSVSNIILPLGMPYIVSISDSWSLHLARPHQIVLSQVALLLLQSFFYVFDGLARFHREIARLTSLILAWRDQFPSDSTGPHPSSISSRRPYLRSHQRSNLKPRRCLISRVWMHVSTGRWSEPQSLRYSTFVWEKYWCQSSLPTALSKLHWTFLDLR